MRFSRLTIAALLLGLASGVQAQQAAPPNSPARQIRGQMEVVGSDGDHIGVVNKVVGDRLDVAKDGPAADGAHQEPPLRAVISVDSKVHLDRSASTAAQDWRPASQGVGGASR